MRLCYSFSTVVFAALFVLSENSAEAQPDRAVPQSARATAAIDLTGNWVAIVNEDWRWRMMTPAPGDVASVPLNGLGRQLANEWDAQTEGSCRAYGAAGLMRMPLRLRISWVGSNLLQIESDAGRQTRRLDFGDTASSATAVGSASLQGHTVAEWQYPSNRRSGPGSGTVGRDADSDAGGALKAITRNLTEGWLRRNGVPYSSQTELTEYFDRFTGPDGAEWLVVTSIVDDPVYLSAPYVTSSHFKQESSGSKWRPSNCVPVD
jgi:hypothetical protein